MPTEKQMKNLKQGKRFKAGDEQTKKAAQKGGISSGKSRMKRKTAREILSAIMSADLPKTKATDQLLKRYGLDDGGDTSALSVILHALTIKAAAGDVKAAAFIIDMLGESAENKLAEARLNLEKRRLKFYEDELKQHTEKGDMPIIVNIRPDIDKCAGDD